MSTQVGTTQIHDFVLTPTIRPLPRVGSSALCALERFW